jgi:hypothetical protein
MSGAVTPCNANLNSFLWHLLKNDAKINSSLCSITHYGRRPIWELETKFTHSSLQRWMEANGQIYAPAALPLTK